MNLPRLVQLAEFALQPVRASREIFLSHLICFSGYRRWQCGAALLGCAGARSKAAEQAVRVLDGRWGRRVDEERSVERSERGDPEERTSGAQATRGGPRSEARGAENAGAIALPIGANRALNGTYATTQQFISTEHNYSGLLHQLSPFYAHVCFPSNLCEAAVDLQLASLMGCRPFERKY